MSQTAEMGRAQQGDSAQGLALALAAYLFWGVLPLYLKLLTHIAASEVVAHRIVWSVPVAGVVLLALGRTSDILTALRTPRMLAMGFVTAGLITVNWTIYVWAILSERAMDAALGYYINPLFSIFLGAVLLGERLTRLQGVAVALAAAAVLVIAFEAGAVPWPALGLTVSWGFYALAKKALPIGPNQGFLLEVLILSVPALAWLGWLAARGEGHFFSSWHDALLLVGCGLVTALPLIVYANGAKKLRLTTMAILQYITPTMVFLMAVFVFDEPFDAARAIAFPMIWAALALYSFTLLRRETAA